MHSWFFYYLNSHQRLSSVDDFNLSAISEGSAELWQSPGKIGTTKSIFLELVPGNDSGWHENPLPQWIIPLYGSWWVETMDGMRVEMGPGEISYGEDQGSSRIDGHLGGHLSGCVGDKPAILMVIQTLD